MTLSIGILGIPGDGADAVHIVHYGGVVINHDRAGILIYFIFGDLDRGLLSPPHA